MRRVKKLPISILIILLLYSRIAIERHMHKSCIFMAVSYNSNRWIGSKKKHFTLVLLFFVWFCRKIAKTKFGSVFFTFFFSSFFKSQTLLVFLWNSKRNYIAYTRWMSALSVWHDSSRIMFQWRLPLTQNLWIYGARPFAADWTGDEWSLLIFGDFLWLFEHGDKLFLVGSKLSNRIDIGLLVHYAYPLRAIYP